MLKKLFRKGKESSTNTIFGNNTPLIGNDPKKNRIHVVGSELRKNEQGQYKIQAALSFSNDQIDMSHTSSTDEAIRGVRDGEVVNIIEEPMLMYKNNGSYTVDYSPEDWNKIIEHSNTDGDRPVFDGIPSFMIETDEKGNSNQGFKVLPDSVEKAHSPFNQKQHISNTKEARTMEKSSEVKRVKSLVTSHPSQREDDGPEM